jgi:hypothetical protein
VAGRLRLDPYQHKTITVECSAPGCGRHRRRIRLRCGKRSCPDCRGRDYVRLVRGYGQAVSQFRHPKLLTATLRNEQKLTAEVVARLRKSFRALVRHLGPLVRGGIYSIEVVNKGHGWHVHIHAVIDAAYIPQRRLSADWLAITGDSFVVDIRRAWSPREALKYILKYLTKEPELLDHLKPIYNSALQGVRLTQPFGVMYRVWKIQRSPRVCPDCGGTIWTSVVTVVTWVSAGLPDDSTANARAPS